MPLYSYEASDTTGRKVSATMVADNEKALRDELRRSGLIPLSIKSVERKKRLSLQRITKKDLLSLTQELGNLLEGGLPIDRALYLLQEHAEKERMRSIIKKIYIDIQKGQSLSQALTAHELFPRFYINMIRAGEAGGMLEPTMKRLSAYLEMTTAFREEIISALIYPLLLTFVGGVSISVLMLYVVPRFAEIFKDMGQALPTPTLILLSMSNALADYWWLALGAIVIALILIRSYVKTKEGKLFLDSLKLRLPFIKRLHLRLIIARFSRTLGTLIMSGVEILEAIRISREVAGNEIISERLKALEDGVRKGKQVSASLSESNVFSPLVVQMIAVGEEAGRLEDAFLGVAERFETESKNLIKRIVSLLEPVMIVLMGVIIGFIVISMLLAVFSIHEIPI